MKNYKFKIGDVVELKSGSPKMTVQHVEAKLSTMFYANDSDIQPEDINVMVAWVDGEGKPQSETYTESMLEFYEKP